MTNEKIASLVRPVFCEICGEPMYYVGDVRHVPEVTVKVRGARSEEFYSHLSCWTERMRAGVIKEMRGCESDAVVK